MKIWSQRLEAAGRRWGLPLALAGLTWLVAWPLLRGGYPTIGDGLIHFYRLVQFDELLRSGVWFPRWATDLGYGFGYPLFNYYSPLAYYLGAGLHALGLSYAQALVGVYALALALAVTGAYVLAAHHWGPAAGLVAAAAYGLAPYFYFNALARGALPETLGLGLLPWVLWAYARLARRATCGGFAVAALLNAALVVTHLLSAVLAAPLIVVSVLMEGRGAGAQGHKGAGERGTPLRNAHRGPSALGPVGAREQATHYQLLITNYILSLLLPAAFLLPAVLELNAVQIGQLTQPGDLDFHNNFLRLGELLAWPRAYDARLVFNAVPASLSLAAVALAVMAGVAGFKNLGARFRAQGTGRWRREGLLAVALLVLALLTLPVSGWVWERLPGLRLVQFPWRLVGPAGLVLALLAGAAVARVVGGRLAGRPGRAGLLVAGVLAALWAFSLAWSFGPPSQALASAGLAELRDYERASGQLGTTSTGEFLPTAVHTLPDPHTLDAAYASGRPAERLAALPQGVTVLSQSAHATGASAEISAATAATLTFNFFDYPGWRATIDGQRVPITASDPNGLITVPVPAGQHQVSVDFGSTPLRTVASLLSALALIALIVITRRLTPSAHHPHTHLSMTAPSADVDIPTHVLSPTPPHRERPSGQSPWDPHTPTLPFALTALALLTARALLLDNRATVFAHSRFDGATVAGVEQPLDVNFDDQIVLIGWDGPGDSVAADGAVAITLYWRAQRVPALDYATTVQVLDAGGHLFGQSDSQHPGRVPTRRWTTDQYARDEHRLRLLPGTPPGAYRLVAGVYPVGGPALPVLDAGHAPQGQYAPLGTLLVTPGQGQAEVDPAEVTHIDLGALTLLGYSVNTTNPQAGDTLRLTLFWRAAAGPRPNVVARVALVTEAGVLAEVTRAPAPATYPTSAWAASQVVRTPLDLRLPAEAPAGPAQLVVSLVAAEAPASPPLAGPVRLATLDVRVPKRSFSVPAMEHALNAPAGGQVRLLGYDLAPTGALTLYWQPGTTLDTGYKVFVHVLGANEQILAQADTVPAGGTRPTTGWLPGEVIADAHSLPLAGARQLAVGLYDEVTGERLGRVVIEAP